MVRELDMTKVPLPKGSMLHVDSVATKGYWNCTCACGKKTVVAGSALRSGNTKSCGCLRKNGGIIAAKNRRGSKLRPAPFIDEAQFLRDAMPFMKPLRDYLKQHGVTFDNDAKMYSVGGRTYGPFRSACAAMLQALNAAVGPKEVVGKTSR